MQIRGLVGLLSFVPIALFADGISPKSKPSDYAAHVPVGNLEIAADYLLHNFSGLNGTFFARDYIVCEVAFYPQDGESYKVDSGDFTLKLEGKRDVLFPESPGAVIASIKYPDWTSHPHVEAIASADGITGTVGRPSPVPRFPDDPRGARNPPRLPKAPNATNDNVQKQPGASAEEVILQTALDDGEHHAAISGYLFFGYSGNAMKIRTVELLYQGPAGPVKLRLR